MYKLFDKEPKVKVGILSAPRIAFELRGTFTADGRSVCGPQEVCMTVDSKIIWNDRQYDRLDFTASSDDCTFLLKEVVIGVNFHWQRKEDQIFNGDLTFLIENGMLTAVDHVNVEDYLSSVISSEMSAMASPALLKAHAVISRSWLLAQIAKHNEINSLDSTYHSTSVTDSEIVKWYDREDHINFHVCADDHCQRYQGIGRKTTPAVDEAIAATRGKVLIYEGKLCDARFSKCCGGVFEEFENCWESVHHPYLAARRDSVTPDDFPDLRIEKNAREGIESSPAAFCNTRDHNILSQVLNNYDRETPDFYRWTVKYTRQELSELVRNRSGIDFGEIISMRALARGTSGRIIRLEISGTKRSIVVGKELEIRRWLSTSHLYSSAFVIREGRPDQSGYPADFTLLGAGWGHGVGLCQIGAAVMGANGYFYDQILSHYFKDSELTQLYT